MLSITVSVVQLAFTTVVFPCLLLAYSGQAAYLMSNRDHAVDAFYRSIPVTSQATIGCSDLDKYSLYGQQTELSKDGLLNNNGNTACSCEMRQIESYSILVRLLNELGLSLTFTLVFIDPR